MSQQSGTLRSQITKSAKLSSLNFASSVGLRLISTVVLTRLLAPEVYGVFAVVLAYLFLLEMFSDLGLRSLVLTREGEVSEGFLRTCWTVSILRGVLIALISCLIALVIAGLQGQGRFPPESAYAAPVLPWAIVAIGAATLLYGFESPMRFVREREMAFGAVTAVDLSRNIITLIVTVALAYYLRSVWALVIGQAVRSALHVGLSFMVFRGPAMRLQLERASFFVLIERGKWVLSQSALTAVSQSADRILLGFVMNSATFGLYYIARQLVDLLPQFLNMLNGAMILQVFTRLQKSTAAEFRRNYYRYRLVVDALAGLGAGGLMVLAPLLVHIIFDDRYQGVAPIMQVIVLAILLLGLLLMRDAFNAARNFKIGSILGFLSMCVLLGGLSYAAFVVGSVQLALYVVALHRLPEALILTVLGWRKGWVVLSREGIILGFFAMGAGLGWMVLQLWDWIR